MFLFITSNQVNHKDNHFTEKSTWFLTFPPFPFFRLRGSGRFLQQEEPSEHRSPRALRQSEVCAQRRHRGLRPGQQDVEQRRHLGQVLHLCVVRQLPQQPLRDQLLLRQRQPQLSPQRQGQVPQEERRPRALRAVAIQPTSHFQ